MDTSVPLHFWAGCPRAFCTTTPPWRWPGYWETAAASGPECSPSCSPTTCSMTGLAVRARERIRGRCPDSIGVVGYARRNFLVPIPSFESFKDLNAYLEAQCRKRLDARLRGHDETIGQRLQRDLVALLPLPATAYDASDKHATRVSSLSLVRYRTNDYSVPVAYGHRDVLVRGYVYEVVISCGPEVIARHRRSYERDDFVFDPLHYLPLLEQKTGALDQAAPLVGWELPEEFAVLRRLLESRMDQRGKREFVQVLRLMENFRREEVHSAVRDALRLGAVSFDAVRHLVLCRIDGRPPRLDMELYPYLPRAKVTTTSAGDYMTLLAGSRS